MATPKQIVKESIEKAFPGHQFNAAQLWALTKFAKMVRLRCRSNAAFNPAMNEIFPHATFQTVTKSRPSRYNPAIQETYPGLKITIKNSSDAVEGDEGEE